MALCNVLSGCHSGMDFGAYKPPTEECVQDLKDEAVVMEKKWKLLQCFGGSLYRKVTVQCVMKLLKTTL